MSYQTQNSTQLLPGVIITNGFTVPQAPKVRRPNKVVFLDGQKARHGSPGLNSVTPLKNSFFTPKISNDIIYENIKPVLSILRIMGCLPITKPSPGVTVCKLTSPAMIYSIVVFVSLITYIITSSLHRVQLRSAEGKFEEVVIEYLFTIYLFPLVMVPLLWYEAPRIGRVLNSWVEFEITYQQLSGTALPVKLYQKSMMMSIVIPVISATSVVITHVTMVHFRVAQIIPYIFLEILTYILGGYWYLLCETLGVCANTLAEDFQQALRHVGPAGRVAEYRALWLRLSKLAQDTGNANCYTFTFVSLYLFLIITLSVYGLLSQISEGFGTKDIGLALTASCSILLLFFICDEAHYASHNVRTNFQKKLLMVELSWMNTDAQTEVNMFLRATEINDSRISLGGFFDVNRNLFKSLLATMVTYLVVLLQFQISIPDDDGSVYDPNFQPDNSTSIDSSAISDTVTTAVTTLLTTVLAKKKKKH